MNQGELRAMDAERREVYRDTTCPKPGQVALYRFYDAHEELLYVGFSNEPWRRRKQHSTTQPWYPRVKHQAITWYDSEQDARKAETRAIRRERPEFNIAGAIRPAAARITIRITTWLPVMAAWIFALEVISYIGVARPSLAAFLMPFLIFMMAGMFLAWAASMLVRAAPRIRRFASWIERNSVHLAKVGAR